MVCYNLFVNKKEENLTMKTRKYPGKGSKSGRNGVKGVLEYA